MKLNLTQNLFLFSYCISLLLISIFCFFEIINVQSGIIFFLMILFMICFLYSFLFSINKNFFEKYFFFLVIFGVIVKLFFSFSNPLWEDDWARYLWEGNLIKLGISPYKHPPEFYFGKNFHFQNDFQSIEILSRINHPDWSAIYSPIIEFYFYVTAIFFPLSISFLKAGYVIFDLAIFLMIKKIGNSKKAILYFLFPVIMKETYLNGHFEIICIFFIVTAIFLFKKKWYKFSFFILGIAIHSKIFLFVLLPYFLFHNSHSKKLNMFYKLFFILFGFVFPYFLFHLIVQENGNFGIDKILLFAKEFEFNSLFFHYIKIFSNHKIAGVICYSILFCFLFYSVIHSKRIFTHKQNGTIWMFYSFLIYLQLSSIVNPWYFLILTPFYFLTYPTLKFSWIIILIPQLAYLTNLNLGINLNNSSEFGFYNLPEEIIYIEFISILIIELCYLKKCYFLSN